MPLMWILRGSLGSLHHPHVLTGRLFTVADGGHAFPSVFLLLHLPVVLRLPLWGTTQTLFATTTMCFMSVPHLVPAGVIQALGSLPSPTTLTSISLISRQAIVTQSGPALISTMAHFPVTPLPLSSVPWHCAQTAVPSSLSSQPISLNQIIAPSNPVLCRGLKLSQRG